MIWEGSIAVYYVNDSRFSAHDYEQIVLDTIGEYIDEIEFGQYDEHCDEFGDNILVGLIDYSISDDDYKSLTDKVIDMFDMLNERFLKEGVDVIDIWNWGDTAE